MGQDHYIGVDVGTGSARACIIDDTGDIKALSSKDIRLWQYPGAHQETYYEQSTEDIWNSISTCVRKVVSDSGADPQSIRGIGFDATCSLAVLSHDTDEPIAVTAPGSAAASSSASSPPAAAADEGEPTRNIILWLDHRAHDETAAINATGHPLLRYVGGTMSVEMEMPKVLWLQRHLAPATFARCAFYDLADALTHLATGAESRSLCSAVCKQGYVPVGVDGSVKGWQPDFYEAIGLGDLVKDEFKRVGGVNGVNGEFLCAGELVGRLSEKAGQELGLPAGIAVGSGVIDAYAGWIGTVGARVALDPGHEGDAASSKADISHAFTRLAAVAGTSTCHLAMCKDTIFVKGVWGPYRDVLIPGYWMAEGGQSATGELLRHVIETHPAHAAALAESQQGKHASIYDFLNSRLEALAAASRAPAVSYLARHLFFYGDLFGNRSPVADARMRGAVVGLSSEHGVEALALLYHAAMESIALQTRQIVEAMNGAGHGIASIFMSGSQCRNGLLVALIATVCGMPVVVPRYVDAAVVHGAAMLGATAASDQSEGLWSVMTRMSKPGSVVRPRTDQAERRMLEAKYKVFLEQCRTQQEYRRMVDEAVGDWAQDSA